MDLPPTLEPQSPSSPTAAGPSVFRFKTSSCYLPLASKGNLGEDALFKTDTAFGVADGVGGWATLGIDAGEYSRKLMHLAENHVRDTQTSDPREILNSAFNGMGQTVGTTTACIVTMQHSKLRAVNLGDSGFLLCRYSGTTCAYEVHLKSRDQQHYFNCPLQIGTDAGDTPHDADYYEFELEESDVVLAATDGVFDNLFEEDIAEILCKHVDPLQGKCDLNAASEAIVKAALKASMNQCVETPFARGAKENKVMHSGGKQDDISVVVGYVARMNPFEAISTASPLPTFSFAPTFAYEDVSVIPPATPLTTAPMKRSRGGS